MLPKRANHIFPTQILSIHPAIDYLSSIVLWVDMPLGIATRFQATQTLRAKLRDTGLPDADVLKTAKDIESGFARAATSEEHYNDLVASFQADTGHLRNGKQQMSLTTCHPDQDPTPEGEGEGEEATGSQVSAISFGRFRNCMEHRNGGSSTVFKSIDPKTSQQVALKVTSNWTQPHDAHREARLLSRLGRANSHILELLETETLRGDFILVFPYYPLTLADLIAENDQTALVSIVRDAAQGLAFIHANGVIHRDIKPANILLKSRTGPATLCDFGTAWAVDDHHADEPPDQKVIDIGTTCYRPPEVLFGYQKYGTEIDIWAFGCVIAEAQTGIPLFDSGELGTDLRLIASIFQILGTPDLESWPVRFQQEHRPL